MPEFDVDGARKAGYSDDEILSHLTQTRKFDVGGAVNSGYSKSDIISHLATTPPPAPKDQIDTLREKWNQPLSWSDKLSFIGNLAASPITGLLNAPREVWDWIKRGGHNPPSGGFMGEPDPASQMVGAAMMAALPAAAAELPALLSKEGTAALKVGGGPSSGIRVPVKLPVLGGFSLELPKVSVDVRGGIEPTVRGLAPIPSWSQGYPMVRPTSTPAQVEINAPPPEPIPSTGTAQGYYIGKGIGAPEPAPVSRQAPAWQGPVTPSELRVPTAVEPIPSDLPSGRTIPSAAERAARASQPSAEPVPAAPDPQTLEDIARSLAGKSFKRMTAEEQAGVRQIADRLSQPTLPEAPQIPPQPTARIDIGPPSPEAPPLSQQVDADLAARRAAGIAPAQPFPGNVVLGPRSAVAASEAPPPPQPPTAAPEAPIAAPRTAEEATAFNRTNKAARFVDALQKSGITAKSLAQIEPGYVSQTQIAQGMTPRWGNIAEFLGEQEPSADTIAEISRQMRQSKGKAALENALSKAKEAAAAAKAKLAVQPAEPAPPSLPEPPAITPGQSVIFPGEQPAVMRNPQAAGYAADLAQQMLQPPEPLAAPPAAEPSASPNALQQASIKNKETIALRKAQLTPGSKAPADMTAGEINKALDKLDKQGSALTDEFIQAGRGAELPSEYLIKTDPLSMRAKSLSDAQGILRNEIERRYGPGAPSRLPKGVGPIKRL